MPAQTGSQKNERSRTTRGRRCGGPLMDWHALSQLCRRQGRGCRLRHAAGARFRRHRAVPAIRSAALSARLASAPECGTLSKFHFDRGCEIASPQPGDVAVFRFGRCYSHGGIVTRTKPTTIVHAYQAARCVLEEDIERNSVLADTRRSPRFFSYRAPERREIP